jgi:hypothetical protein
MQLNNGIKRGLVLGRDVLELIGVNEQMHLIHNS